MVLPREIYRAAYKAVAPWQYALYRAAQPAIFALILHQISHCNRVGVGALGQPQLAFYNSYKRLPFRQLREQIVAEGIDKVLEQAGFELRLPSCSACLAMNPDKVPAGKLCISTSNRNFVGRQGPGARTILASPLTVAASAVTGVITDPRKL